MWGRSRELQQSDTEEAAKTQILAHNLNMLADKACAFFSER